MKLYTTKIRKVEIVNSYLAIGIFYLPNLIEFDNIRIYNNVFETNRFFMKTDHIRSYDMMISYNSFYYKICFLDISITIPVDRLSAL